MDYSKLTREEILNGIKNNTINMENLSKELRDDKAIALEAVKNDINAIKYISSRLQSDKEIVISTVKARVVFLKESARKQKENYIHLTEAQVLNGIKEDVIDFKDLPEKFRDNKKILLEAINEQSWAFEYASQRLKKDKEVVIRILENGEDIKSFEFASDELQNDKDLLELLEKKSFIVTNWKGEALNWYKEKMELLANIREQEIMSTSIIVSNKVSKKNKF